MFSQVPITHHNKTKTFRNHSCKLQKSEVLLGGVKVFDYQNISNVKKINLKVNISTFLEIFSAGKTMEAIIFWKLLPAKL